MWNLLTLMWNLDPKPLCGTFMRNLYVKLLFGTGRPNLLAKRLCETFLWNLGTFICGTWELVRVEPLSGILGNLTLYVEPEILRVEPLCGTFGNLVPGFGLMPQTAPFSFIGPEEKTTVSQVLKGLTTLVLCGPQYVSRFGLAGLEKPGSSCKCLPWQKYAQDKYGLTQRKCYF